jgi:hypothetical protein
MPVIELACPFCHATAKAPEKAAGKAARCPKCGKKCVVPDPFSLPPTSAWERMEGDALRRVRPSLGGGTGRRASEHAFPRGAWERRRIPESAHAPKFIAFGGSASLPLSFLL